jgi:hypothetical protein
MEMPGSIAMDRQEESIYASYFLTLSIRVLLLAQMIANLRYLFFELFRLNSLNS